MSEMANSEGKMTIDSVSETIVTEHLQELVKTLSTLPTLLKAPVRSLKIMSAMRGYPVLNKNGRQIYKETSRIYLIGNWISKAGLSRQERIKVIPLHRLLIIIPDENL